MHQTAFASYPEARGPERLNSDSGSKPTLMTCYLPRRAPINGFRNRIAGAPAVPHCEITVGSRRTGCSNSHRFYSSPAVPRFGCSLLLSFCVSRFTVNKKAQSPAKRYSIRVRFARVSCPWLRLMSDTTYHVIDSCEARKLETASRSQKFCVSSEHAIHCHHMRLLESASASTVLEQGVLARGLRAAHFLAVVPHRGP